MIKSSGLNPLVDTYIPICNTKNEKIISDLNPMVDSFHVNVANISQDSGETGVKNAYSQDKCSQCTEREALSGTCDTKFNFLLIFKVLCLVSLVLTLCLDGSILLDSCYFSQFNNENCEKEELQ